MAQLKYCDKHNQVGFLRKPDESAGFAEIVDFLRGSNLRYALTTNPTIYDSLVKQFWQTAVASTREDGSLEISATVDTKRYIISEASIRDSLQLDDATGISMLPNDDLFQGMGQIGEASQKVMNVGWVSKVEDLVFVRFRGWKEPEVQGRKSQADPQDSSKQECQGQLTKEGGTREDQSLQAKGKDSLKLDFQREDNYWCWKRLILLLREGKAPMLSEETPKKTKEQILQEEASLAEAIRLDSLQREEEAEQIHLDALLAQRIAEEEELTEQQKKRKAQVQFEAQHYTNEDWDLIRAKLEANAELSKSMLGSELQGEDFAKKMVDLVNQRKKFFAEERAKAKRNKPMTQSQLKTYMMNYLKNQGSWKLNQLRKLSFEELQTKTPKRLKEDKDDEAKDDEPTKKLGKRRKQIARKGMHTSVDENVSDDSDKVDEQEETNTGGQRIDWALSNTGLSKRQIKSVDAGGGPKWLFDIDVLTKLMNYVPVVACTNSSNFEGTEESIGAGHSSKETRSSQDYILMPLWKDGSLFDSSSKNASNDEPQPSSEAGKKDDEGVSKESGIDDQEMPENSTQDVNTAGPSVNTEPDMFSLGDNATLEATHADFFGNETEMDMSNITTTYLVPSTPNTRIYKDHSLDHEEPKRIAKAVFWNKKDEKGIVIWNKARLVEQGHTQEEGIDYDEVFAPLARIEVVRLFLAYASFMGFMVYQMDVKSAFLYGKIEEEVYVCQPLGFEDLDYPDKVYKVVKAHYGLHQALRAYYETLAKYLLDNGFHKGKIDQTLFIKKQKGDILLVRVYVDDIIFGSTKMELCTEFEKLMHDKFQMSSMRELTFFLGLQVKQKEDMIFISQDKYVADILRKFSFTDVRTASTPMDTKKPLLKDSDGDDVDVYLYRSMIGSLMYLTSSRPAIMFTVCACARFQVTPKVSHLHAVKRTSRYLKGQPKLGLWYPKDSSFDLVAYSDSDYARASLDRKSTTEVVVDRIRKGVWLDLVIPIMEFVRGKAAD
ncbi:putative ribonuclease H-like domain-containing protein [Tanacetum coccineum]